MSVLIGLLSVRISLVSCLFSCLAYNSGLFASSGLLELSLLFSLNSVGPFSLELFIDRPRSALICSFLELAPALLNPPSFTLKLRRKPVDSA